MAPLDLTDDMIMDVVQRLSGGFIPTKNDFVSLQHWLLCFIEAISELRLIIAYFAEWLSNYCPPGGCLLLTSGHLIGLDNHTGVWLVGVGDTW